jgi:hypothetical protein
MLSFVIEILVGTIENGQLRDEATTRHRKETKTIGHKIHNGKNKKQSNTTQHNKG